MQLLCPAISASSALAEDLDANFMLARINCTAWTIPWKSQWHQYDEPHATMAYSQRRATALGRVIANQEGCLH